MKDLDKGKDIIVATAEKSRAVVIMDIENYIKEADHQLSDKSNYKILQTDPQ